ncbi:hypothetical protein JCM6882_001568 [Rhodosporidiobolus microsporus]
MLSNVLAKPFRTDEQRRSALQPSPPRLPLELLFLIADLVLSGAKDKDETEFAARQLCAVDRAFHERYGRRRKLRIVAVQGRAEILLLNVQARADPAYARAVEAVRFLKREKRIPTGRDVQQIKRNPPALRVFSLPIGWRTEFPVESFEALPQSCTGFSSVSLGDMSVSSPTPSASHHHLPPTIQYLQFRVWTQRHEAASLKFTLPSSTLVVLDLTWFPRSSYNPAPPSILHEILSASSSALKALRVYRPSSEDPSLPFLDGLTFPRLRVLHTSVASFPPSLLTPQLTHVHLWSVDDDHPTSPVLPLACRQHLDSLFDDVQQPALESWVMRLDSEEAGRDWELVTDRLIERGQPALESWVMRLDSEEAGRDWELVTDRLIERGVRVQVETAGGSGEPLPTFADEVRASFGLDIPEWR